MSQAQDPTTGSTPPTPETPRSNSAMWYVIGGLVIVGLVAWLMLSRQATSSPAATTPSTQTQTESSLTEDMATTEPATDPGAQTTDKSDVATMQTLTYDYVSSLADVTIAQNVTEVNTGGRAGGEAKAVFTNDTYSLMATFTNLPDPGEGYFYEGWVVRKEPFHFVSTGKITLESGVYTNMYQSTEDLTDHTRYVLTIEPDDNDPAPAGHVVEGTLTLQ